MARRVKLLPKQKNIRQIAFAPVSHSCRLALFKGEPVLRQMICALVLVGSSFTSTVSGQTTTDRNKRALPAHDLRVSKTTEAIANDRKQANVLDERLRAKLEPFMAAAEQARCGTRRGPSH